ncbi:hypothetical protein HZC34_01185 [Candidatus Saganbacteria bacterium]|nr:hypothetical protein [Candidatus Saganbacteria bacterium]
MKDCKEFFIKVKKQNLVFYAPFFDAYQGMLSQRTPKPPKGNEAFLQFLVSPDFIHDFKKLIKRLKLKIEKSN